MTTHDTARAIVRYTKLIQGRQADFMVIHKDGEWVKASDLAAALEANTERCVTVCKDFGVADLPGIGILAFAAKYGTLDLLEAIRTGGT